MSAYWKDSSVLVTGGYGFLGSHLCDALTSAGANVFRFRSDVCDLTDRSQARAIFSDAERAMGSIGQVFHLAAYVGGIGANMREPGRMFYDNMAMGINVIDEARLRDVPKLICVGTVCSYPEFPSIPFREEELWDGYPEPTNAPYGIAKRALLTMLQAYRQQYGLNSIYLLLANLYGPGDNFDPESSHVIPALVRRICEAKAQNLHEVGVWGDGTATRDFLYVHDAVRAIMLAARHYSEPEPVNIGTGLETSIRYLAYMIANIVDWDGHFIWDIEKPGGQPRRVLDINRARKLFGFDRKVGLWDGLYHTVDWFQREIAGESERI